MKLELAVLRHRSAAQGVVVINNSANYHANIKYCNYEYKESQTILATENQIHIKIGWVLHQYKDKIPPKNGENMSSYCAKNEQRTDPVIRYISQYIALERQMYNNLYMTFSRLKNKVLSVVINE